MEDGSIADNQITASSYASGVGYSRQPWEGRLNYDKWSYWAPINPAQDSTPWIQVAFSSAVTITAIQTQGGGFHSAWVTELEIQTGQPLSYILQGSEPAVS